MGLDVYLIHATDRAASRAIEEECERRHEEAWNFDGRKYDALTQAEKDAATAACKAIDAELGIVDYHHGKLTRISDNSVKYPDHYFKVGYLRSSYNEGGINRILKNMGLPDLYEIFNRGEDDPYEFQPDWRKARDACAEVLQRLRSAQDRGLRVTFVGPNIFGYGDAKPPETEVDAMKVYIDQKRTHDENNKNKTPEQVKAWGSSYSNILGVFDHDGLKVRAMMPGLRDLLGQQRGVYVVFESEDAEWYEQALEITLEMIDAVLAAPDPENYYLQWSA